MIIIVEGHDGVGKSLLASELSHFVYIDVYDESFKHSIEFDVRDYKNFIRGYNIAVLQMLMSMDDIIKDRFHLSEKVYSKIYNRKSLFSFSQIEELISKRKDVFLILLTCDYDTYLKRVKERTEPVIEKEHYLEANSEFLKAFDESILKKMHLDTSNLTIDDELNKIAEFLDNEKSIL